MLPKRLFELDVALSVSLNWDFFICMLQLDGCCLQDLVFAILIADGQLITLVRLKKCMMHPADLHLIFNLVTASDTFKHAESWTPICLPKFDSKYVNNLPVSVDGT
jgi:Second Longin domain of FUZ, MON1 and HPS1